MFLAVAAECVAATCKTQLSFQHWTLFMKEPGKGFPFCRRNVNTKRSRSKGHLPWVSWIRSTLQVCASQKIGNRSSCILASCHFLSALSLNFYIHPRSAFLQREKLKLPFLFQEGRIRPSPPTVIPDRRWWPHKRRMLW